MERGKRITTAEEIRAFATDLFNFIWTKHQFCNESLERKFAAQLSLSFSDSAEARISPFNDNIGIAVLCTQYLLREQSMDLFRHFKELLIQSKKSFIYCVNLIQLICSECRTDVFLRLIDIGAIIAEAVLFCDSQAKPLIELHEAPDILIGFFEVYISKPFFRKGGWQQLQTLALSYSPIYSFITAYINRCNVPYVILYYDCKLIKYLRECPVSFPVQVSWFCEKCRVDSDKPFQILSPESTIEELISKHSLQQPPWEDELNKNISTQELKSGTSQSSSSILKDRFYIFLGEGFKPTDLLEVKAKRTPKKKRKHKRSQKSEREETVSKET